MLQTLSELENGTENFVTEDELNTLLANYPTNEQLTTQLNGKANVGMLPEINQLNCLILT